MVRQLKKPKKEKNTMQVRWVVDQGVSGPRRLRHWPQDAVV
jgi:hypothetical protein